MDPDQALRDARSALRNMDEGVLDDEDALTLANAFEALDGWLSKGGFPPVEWADMSHRTPVQMAAAPYVTKSGRVLTEQDIQELADEAERGYPADRITERVERITACPESAHGRRCIVSRGYHKRHQETPHRTALQWDETREVATYLAWFSGGEAIEYIQHGAGNS